MAYTRCQTGLSDVRCFVAPLILATLAAAAPVAAQDMRVGSVAGIAADSLHERPLVGALITVEHLGRSAISDSAGVFRIDSIPAGERRLAVFHPLLDSLRISLVSSALAVTADTTLNVVIAIPSAASLLSLKCGSNTAAAIIGSVSIADDLRPPSDGLVELSWIETIIGRGIGIRHNRQSARARVDDNGTFQLCGVPPDVVGELVALSRVDTSGAVAGTSAPTTISFGGSRLVIVGLVLPGTDVEAVGLQTGDLKVTQGDAAGVAPTPLRRGRATISGVVTDSAGAPVSGASVGLAGAVGATTTDSAGRFVLRNQPSGSGMLVVRKLGLAMVEMPVALSTAAVSEINVRMATRSVAVLTEVIVSATRLEALDRIGFLSRRQRRPGSFFLDPNAMDKASTRSSLAVVLADAPNLSYVNGRIFGRRIRGGTVSIDASQTMALSRGYTCVWWLVDGHPWSGGSPTDALRPQDVAAIEVYYGDERPSDLPFSSHSKPMQGADSVCETIVIWTRQYLGIE